MRIFVLTATYELRVSRKSHLRDHPSCQVAEIPAKKLKRGHRKKSWPKEFVAEILPKSGRKGAAENF
jgi:hypothetical protein